MDLKYIYILHTVTILCFETLLKNPSQFLPPPMHKDDLSLRTKERAWFSLKGFLMVLRSRSTELGFFLHCTSDIEYSLWAFIFSSYHFKWSLIVHMVVYTRQIRRKKSTSHFVECLLKPIFFYSVWRNPWFQKKKLKL